MWHDRRVGGSSAVGPTPVLRPSLCSVADNHEKENLTLQRCSGCGGGLLRSARRGWRGSNGLSGRLTRAGVGSSIAVLQAASAGGACMILGLLA